MILTNMKTLGFEEKSIETLQGLTGVTLIRLDGHDREFIHEEFGVGENWVPSTQQISQLDEFEWIHLAGPVVASNVVKTLAEKGHRRSVDFSTSRLTGRLDGVEIAFSSWRGKIDEGAHALAARQIDAGAKIAVVTCGSGGSLARIGTNTTVASALPITPLDTCGAGDSYIATFVEKYLSGINIHECVKYAPRVRV
jgi:fructoselysine 6-kinase